MFKSIFEYFFNCIVLSLYQIYTHEIFDRAQFWFQLEGLTDFSMIAEFSRAQVLVIHLMYMWLHYDTQCNVQVV